MSAETVNILQIYFLNDTPSAISAVFLSIFAACFRVNAGHIYEFY